MTAGYGRKSKNEETRVLAMGGAVPLCRARGRPHAGALVLEKGAVCTTGPLHSERCRALAENEEVLTSPIRRVEDHSRIEKVARGLPSASDLWASAQRSAFCLLRHPRTSFYLNKTAVFRVADNRDYRSKRLFRNSAESVDLRVFDWHKLSSNVPTELATLERIDWHCCESGC